MPPTALAPIRLQIITPSSSIPIDYRPSRRLFQTAVNASAAWPASELHQPTAPLVFTSPLRPRATGFGHPHPRHGADWMCSAGHRAPTATRWVCRAPRHPMLPHPLWRSASPAGLYESCWRSTARRELPPSRSLASSGCAVHSAQTRRVYGTPLTVNALETTLARRSLAGFCRSCCPSQPPRVDDGGSPSNFDGHLPALPYLRSEIGVPSRQSSGYRRRGLPLSVRPAPKTRYHRAPWHASDPSLNYPCQSLDLSAYLRRNRAVALENGAQRRVASDGVLLPGFGALYPPPGTAGQRPRSRAPVQPASPRCSWLWAQSALQSWKPDHRSHVQCASSPAAARGVVIAFICSDGSKYVGADIGYCLKACSSAGDAPGEVLRWAGYTLFSISLSSQSHGPIFCFLVYSSRIPTPEYSLVPCLPVRLIC